MKEYSVFLIIREIPIKSTLRQDFQLLVLSKTVAEDIFQEKTTLKPGHYTLSNNQRNWNMNAEKLLLWETGNYVN